MDEADFERKELEHLANIEGELEEIRRRTPTGFRSLVHGVLSGSGAVLGAIVAVMILGLVLYFFNILGFAHIASYLSGIVAQAHR